MIGFFSTIPHREKISPTNIKLSDEYMAIVIAHLKEYLFNEQSEELRILKELCGSEDES